jgi:hypothetical protein
MSSITHSQVYAKCWDGVFRIITLIADKGYGANATVTIGGVTLLGVYCMNESGELVFAKP